MKSKLNIPNNINVGFQNRGGTYTGKLAYVIYTDDKGVLRKEKSWNGWRDQKIKPQEFENVPTDGFVLNKKVGETRWGWNPRKAWVRVYDPRDFEFEISVANLLFILEECSSIKGKGLEGEFVYTWSGADLLLLPVSSQEYKDSMAFKEAVQNKIAKDDIKEGHCYLSKDGDEVMLLGRLLYWGFHKKDTRLEFKSQKKNIFAYLNKKGYLIQTTGFKDIVSKLNDDPSPLFAEKFEEYKKSKYGSGPKKLVQIKKNTSYYGANFVKEDGEYYYTQEAWIGNGGYYGGRSRNGFEKMTEPVKMIPGKSVIVPLKTTTTSKLPRDHQQMSLCIINESGKKLEIGDYYYG